MRRITTSASALLLVAVLAQPAFACAGLYSWFDRVFGFEGILPILPAFDLPSTLDELPGHVILGNEIVDNFRGCAVGRIVQFRSGTHVVCDDYGYDYASYGTEVVIVARPSLSGKDRYVCNFHCKMIVTDFFDNDVFDVSCEDYMADMYGSELGADVEITDADVPEVNATEVITPVETPDDTSDRVDLGRWNWLYDLPGGPSQESLDLVYELAESCEQAERLGWPVSIFHPSPSMCENLGDLYP